jgi:sodium/bile acid cotransporter 7
VSTAIVFTSLAGGNAAGALLNATLSNVLGVIVTPLWVGVLLQARGEHMSVLPLMRQLALLILLPLLLGQLLRPVLWRRLGGFLGYPYKKIKNLVVVFVAPFQVF